MPSNLSNSATKPDRLTVRQDWHLSPPWLVPPSAVATAIKAVGSRQLAVGSDADETNSAHTNAAEMNILFNMVDSPNEVVGEGEGRRPAPVDTLYTDTEYTPARVRSLHDYERFAALVMAGEFSEATRFCQERILAGGDLQRVKWTNNASTVKRAEGRPADSLTLLYLNNAVVEPCPPVTRGIHHNNLGFTFQLLGKPDEALDNYLRAASLHTDPVMKAGVSNNLGRLLVSMDAPAEAIKHLDEALKAAREADDLLLRGEVLESFALAFEAQGEIKSARRAALSSVETLEGTGYRLAEEESRATLERLVRAKT
jgi:tetratricopeptide (TPR) repeat protein